MTEMMDHSSDPGESHRATLRRGLVMAAICAVCFVLLRERVADISVVEVWSAMAAIPMQTILFALMFGVISHIALAGYDLLALRRIGKRIPWPRALVGGFSGTVFSQVLGFGLITGSFARARIYRANGITASSAIALSGLVAAGFFTGLGVLLALLMLIDPSAAIAITGTSGSGIRIASASALIIACATCWLAAGKTLQFPAIGLRLNLPDLRWLSDATTLAMADLVPAALCLAVMLPADGIPNIASFIAIYITALALGHLIGSPGGAGPFEGVLFLALPAIGANELAAGILMYRLTYYLPAFIVAAASVLAARRAPNTTLLTGDALRNRVLWSLDETPNAEAELVWLGDKHIHFPANGNTFVSYGIAGRIWLVMGDPIGPKEDWADLIDGLEAEARAAGATLAVYKATTPSCDFWQARGWMLQPLGQEGTISLAEFSLEGRKHRELRRKCRSIDKAGIELRQHAPSELSLRDANKVAAAWCSQRQGPEQTFSMGHWTHGFASRHPSVSAWQDGRMIAFATFWISGNGQEWMLDLMRQGPDVPNGTMHRLLVEAAETARAQGADRLNLCMAPMSGLSKSRPVTRLSRLGEHIFSHYNARHGLQGNRRFKDMFRPDWQPRYLACRSPLTVPEALFAAHQLIDGKINAETAQTDRSPILAAGLPFNVDHAKEFADDAPDLDAIAFGQPPEAATG